jgi:Spy/CpxP family protein refolding chaperone
MLKWVFAAAFLPGMLCAQMPMGQVCRQGSAARDLNLSDAQQKQITDICKDNFKKVSDLREAWRKAEAELQTAFDQSPVDLAKSNEAIERLVAARSDLFRATSQMDLKIRTVLTDDQWRELKQRERGPGRPGGPAGGWRRGGASTKSTAPTGQPQQNK